MIRLQSLRLCLVSHRRWFSDLAQRVAVVDAHGSHTYSDLSCRADALRRRLLADLPSPGDGLPPRVALLCSRDLSYVVSTLAVWSAGGCAVPLGLAYPARELAYFVRDCGARTLLCSPDLVESGVELQSALRLDGGEDVELSVLQPEDFLDRKTTTEHVDLSRLMPFTSSAAPSSPATVVYTSGTTGPPKGVLVSHRCLGARVKGMVTAWEWKEEDVLLNTLPLHHVHGVENCLLTPLAVGARVLLLPEGDRFNAEAVWREMLGAHRPNLFMAVPTMYAKLAAHLRQQGDLKKQDVKRKCVERFRLMVSGSAPLPDPILHEWEALTGHRLLERYGMSEVGMALSNPLHGSRRPGHVGAPMPGVEVRIVDADTDDVLCEADSLTATVHAASTVGELHVRGPAVFSGYLARPAATADAFAGPWFRTGDTAEWSGQAFRLLGRSSVDVLKVGGFKVSALDVERRLLGHAGLAAAAVVGLEDPVYGQRVVAVVVGKQGCVVDPEEVKEWARTHMARYQVPAEVTVVKELPTNNMGKVDKREIVRRLQE